MATLLKSSGEEIYFAAKSARMCAETIVEVSNGGQRIPTEAELKLYLKRWDKVRAYLQSAGYPAKRLLSHRCHPRSVWPNVFRYGCATANV